MHHTLIRCTLVAAAAAATLTAQKYQFSPTPPFWAGYGRDPAHTAQVTTGSQPLNQIRWSTPVDLQPQ